MGRREMSFVKNKIVNIEDLKVGIVHYLGEWNPLIMDGSKVASCIEEYVQVLVLEEEATAARVDYDVAEMHQFVDNIDELNALKMEVAKEVWEKIQEEQEDDKLPYFLTKQDVIDTYAMQIEMGRRYHIETFNKCGSITLETLGSFSAYKDDEVFNSFTPEQQEKVLFWNANGKFNYYLAVVQYERDNVVLGEYPVPLIAKNAGEFQFNSDYPEMRDKAIENALLCNRSPEVAIRLAAKKLKKI